MILKLDSKHRLTIPAKFAPVKPGDYFEAAYLKSEDAIVLRRIRLKGDWSSVLKKTPAAGDDSLKSKRKKSKKNK